MPPTLTGETAERVRNADAIERPRAVELLENTLMDCRTRDEPLPNWLVGRLAALYRSDKRYDDEVLLLEEYALSQVEDSALRRFDARLIKARILADRNRRADSGALASVRKIKPPKRRRVDERPESEGLAG